MNKKGKRGFKMKGFSPFTTESSSPMKNIMEGVEDDPGSYTFTERELRGYTPRGMSRAEKRALRKARKERYNKLQQERREKRQQTQGYQNMITPKTKEQIKEEKRKEREANEREAAIYRSPHRAEPSAQGQEHMHATGLDDFSASERRAILGSKSGINATIDKSLMRGMDPGSHEGRKHVGRINALRQFKEEMDGGQITTPEQYQAYYHKYQERLARSYDKNRISNFIGEDSYDKYGRSKVEQWDKYKKQRRDAVGVDPKTGRYILADESGMSETEIAELRRYNLGKSYEDKAHNIDDLRARQNADNNNARRKRRGRKRRRR